jgi:type IV secretion system protein VirB6
MAERAWAGSTPRRSPQRLNELDGHRRDHVWRFFLMDSVSTILTTLDAAITAAGQRFFEATASAVGPIYSSLLALLLVMVGINAALNVYRIAMRDAVQLAFRIVMVLMFGLTWSNFSQIYQAASNGLSDLALEYFRLGGSGVATSATAAMDDMANMMAGNVDSVSSAMSSIMRGFVAAILYVVLGILMAVYVFIVGFAKLMIAFLLGVAPLAIGATIFEKTKGIFEAWLSAMIGYLMYPVASAGIIVAVVTWQHDVFREDDARHRSRLDPRLLRHRLRRHLRLDGHPECRDAYHWADQPCQHCAPGPEGLRASLWKRPATILPGA